MEKQSEQLPKEVLAEAGSDIQEGHVKLHMHTLALTFTHLLLLGAWVWLSQHGKPTARVLLGLLILTALNWLWLCVVGKKWWVLWRLSEKNAKPH